MKIEIIAVTPAIAQEWLNTNSTNNRKKSKRLIAQYANDMIAGRWEITGEAVKFDSNGRLIDGQHRLSAVIASKKTIQMAVIHGLDPKAIHVIDTGKSRNGADALTIAGQGENASNISALARKIIVYRGGNMNVMGAKKIRLAGQPITNRDILEYCAVNDLQPYVRFAFRMKSAQIASIFSVSEWAFIYWLLCQTDNAAAAEFCTRLATLDNVGMNSPIRVLFEKIVRSQFRLTSAQTIHATITAWNAWRTGATLRTIRVTHVDEAIPRAV